MDKNNMTIKLDVRPEIALLMSISLSTKPGFITNDGDKPLHDIAKKITDQVNNHVAVFGEPDSMDTNFLKEEEGREI